MSSALWSDPRKHVRVSYTAISLFPLQGNEMASPGTNEGAGIIHFALR